MPLLSRRLYRLYHAITSLLLLGVYFAMIVSHDDADFTRCETLLSSPFRMWFSPDDLESRNYAEIFVHGSTSN